MLVHTSVSDHRTSVDCIFLVDENSVLTVDELELAWHTMPWPTATLIVIIVTDVLKIVHQIISCQWWSYGGLFPLTDGVEGADTATDGLQSVNLHLAFKHSLNGE